LSFEIQDVLVPHSYTAIFTTIPGVVGGVGRYVKAKPYLMAFTLPELTIDVLKVSATDGYVVEKVLENLFEKLKKHYKENMNKVFGKVLVTGTVYGLVKLFKKQNVPELSNNISRLF